MRQCRDDDITLLPFVTGPHADTADTALVDLHQLFAGGNNLRLGGIVRPLDVFQQFRQFRFWGLQQMYAGTGHLAQIMRRNIGGQTHGNTGGAIEQDIGYSRGQYRRFFQGAVKVRYPSSCSPPAAMK